MKFFWMLQNTVSELIMLNQQGKGGTYLPPTKIWVNMVWFYSDNIISITHFAPELISVCFQSFLKRVIVLYQSYVIFQDDVINIP